MKKYKVFIWMSSLFVLILIWKISSIESGDVLIEDGLPVLAKKHGINQVTIYCVTPTYWRYVQKAELIRILQTLTLASFKVNIKWILVEDSEKETQLVRNLLKRIDDDSLGFQYVHLFAKTPPFEKIRNKDPRWKRHRGIEQRNTALKWIRENVKAHGSRKILYFMDDDNTYDVNLFTELAKVKNVGVWPVGLVGGFNVETPILNAKTGKVTGYRSGWKPDRPFAIDMAGFGINIDLILAKPQAQFSYTMEKGYQESQFLQYFTTKEELEPLAQNCTKVYVWHTRTEKPDVKGQLLDFEV